MTVEAEGVIADAVLEAARAVVAQDQSVNTPASLRPWRKAGSKNEPLLLLLDALVDAATATANAAADNAWDDHLPIPGDLARGLADACHRLGDTITAAAAAPNAEEWSLPSMTGKELV